MSFWISLLLFMGICASQNNQANNKPHEKMMLRAIQSQAKCSCGKVHLSIDSPSALRMVVYSKDYRGYYRSLNEIAKEQGKPQVAPIDPFGGIDLIQIYPSEIQVTKGTDLIETVLIREGSPIRRSYSTCCDTPLFDIGNAAMLNSDLLKEEEKPEVEFRIIGRHSLKGDGTIPKPAISWSLPWNWAFTMFKRMDSSKKEPAPVDLSKPTIMRHFKEG